MARSEHLQPKSDLITGGIYTSRQKIRVSNKPQPKITETLIDYNSILDDVLRAYVNYVDQLFPNADFLSQQEGSHIKPGTKLSFILRSRYSNLTQMKLPKALAENFRKTVRNFLDKIRYRS